MSEVSGSGKKGYFILKVVITLLLFTILVVGIYRYNFKFLG